MISPFFAELGVALERAGRRVLRVNVDFGDLMLLGERRLYQVAAIAAARSRGIAVATTDFGPQGLEARLAAAGQAGGTS